MGFGRKCDVKMAVVAKKRIKICPNVADLEANAVTNVLCDFSGCQRRFTSLSAVRLHRVKVHKIIQDEDDLKLYRGKKCEANDISDCTYAYHCPVDKCQYSDSSPLHFSTLALLKQHYKRVHGKRTFQCNQCGGSFAYERDLKKHTKAGCHVIIECKDCHNRYSSLESLTVHRRRKHTSFATKDSSQNHVEKDVSSSQQQDDSNSDEGDNAVDDRAVQNKLIASTTIADVITLTTVAKKSLLVSSSPRSVLPKPCAVSSPIYILPVMTVVVNSSTPRSCSSSHSGLLVAAATSPNNALEALQQRSIAVQASGLRPSVATQTVLASLQAVTINRSSNVRRAPNGGQPVLSSSSTQTASRKHIAAHTQTIRFGDAQQQFVNDNHLQVSFVPDLVRQSSVAVLSPRSTSSRTTAAHHRRKAAQSKDTQTSSTVRICVNRKRNVADILSQAARPIIESEMRDESSHECTNNQLLAASSNRPPSNPRLGTATSCNGLLNTVGMSPMFAAANYELALAESIATQTCDFGSGWYDTGVAATGTSPAAAHSVGVQHSTLADFSTERSDYNAAMYKHHQSQQDGAFAASLPNAAVSNSQLASSSTDLVDTRGSVSFHTTALGGGGGSAIDIETQTGNADFDFTNDDFLSPDVQRLFADAACMNMETQTSMDDIIDQLLSDMQTQTADTRTCSSVGTDSDLQFGSLLASYSAVAAATSGVNTSPLGLVNIHTQTSMLAPYSLPPDVAECDTQTNLEDWLLYS